MPLRFFVSSSSPNPSSVPHENGRGHTFTEPTSSSASRSRRMRRSCAGSACLLASSVLALSFAAPLRADRTTEGHADYDRVVLEADFVGIIHLENIEAPDDSGVAHANARVIDTWTSILEGFSNDASVRIPFQARTRAFAALLRPGTDALVMISGGPWQDTPFTFGRNTVFPVAQDGAFTCVSGNPLFGLRYGIYCSTQDKMPGHPLTASEAQTSFLAARDAATRRFPNVVAAIGSGRSLTRLPSTAVDRTVLGQQVPR